MEANTAKEPALLEVKANLPGNLDMESYKAYYRFVLLRNPTTWGIWFIPLLIALPSLLAYFSWELFIFLGIFIVFMFVLSAVLSAIGHRMSYKIASKYRTECDLTYAFYPDDYQVTHISPLSTGIQTNRYEWIKTVHETKSAFYLQSTSQIGTIHVLDKKDFAPEQIAALQELLAEQLGKKFKGMKAKKQEA